MGFRGQGGSSGATSSRPVIRNLLVVGNSYAAATGGAVSAGASAAKYRYSTAVSHQLGASEHNIAVNGAYMHRPHLAAVGDGGYADILQAYVPSRTGTPPLSDIDAVIISTGLNDTGLLGSANLAPWTEATRRVLCRLRAGVVFEDGDASITYTGSWSLHGQTYLNSGIGTRNTTVVGDTLSIAVPSWFPGGEIDLGFVLANGFVSNATIAVDGAQVDAFAYGTGFIPAAATYTGMVRRLTGLAAGAHTILVTVTAGSTIMVFDSWEIPALSPPIIEFPLQPYLASPGANSQNSDIDTLNGLIKSLSASFTDGRVRNPDINTAIGGQARYFNGGAIGGGGDHPNDEGHQVIASVVAADLASALSLYGNERPAASAVFWHLVANLAGTPPYNEPVLANSWAPAAVAGYTVPAFRKDRGRVSLRGLIKTGAAGATAFTLPDGFRPPLNLIVPITINNASVRSIGFCAINSDGTVQPLNSGSTWTGLDGVIFDAA